MSEISIMIRQRGKSAVRLDTLKDERCARYGIDISQISVLLCAGNMKEATISQVVRL